MNANTWIVLTMLATVYAAFIFMTIVVMMKKRRCPDCGAELPLVRTPKTARQFVWGGWTCPKCTVELDRAGEKIVA